MATREFGKAKGSKQSKFASSSTRRRPNRHLRDKVDIGKTDVVVYIMGVHGAVGEEKADSRVRMVGSGATRLQTCDSVIGKAGAGATTLHVSSEASENSPVQLLVSTGHAKTSSAVAVGAFQASAVEGSNESINSISLAGSGSLAPNGKKSFQAKMQKDG